MRLLIIHGSELDAPEALRHTLGLALALGEAGHRVELLTPRQLFGEALRSRLQQAGLPLWEELPDPPFDRAGEPPDESTTAPFRSALGRRLEALQPEAVLTQHFSLTSRVSLAEAERRGIPTTVISHGREPSENGPKDASSVFARATARIAVSAAARDRLCETLGLPPESIEIVPPGAGPLPPRGGLKRTRPVAVLAYLPLALPSGPQQLLGSLPRIARAHPEIRLSFAGDGPDRAFLEELVGTLDAGDRAQASKLINRESRDGFRAELLAGLGRRFLAREEIPLRGELVSRVRFLGELGEPELGAELALSRVVCSPLPTLPSSLVIDAFAHGCLVCGPGFEGAGLDLVEWLGDRLPEVRRARGGGSRPWITRVAQILGERLSAWTPSVAATLAQAVEQRHDWRGIAPRLLPHEPRT